MPQIEQFSIHGDNIVECERTLDQILRAFGAPSTAVLAVDGSPFAPTVIASLAGISRQVTFQLFPGFGRWDGDILDLIRKRGGKLREAADSVICRVDEGHHTPILAIEYCGALPAGNQAWQRSGRAYSFANSGIPYFYIAEIGGFELNADRQRKSERMPNPVVPASYLIMTKQYSTPVLPVFVMSPGASREAVETYAPFVGETQFLRVLRHAIVRGGVDEASVQSLSAAAFQFLQYLADNRPRHDGFTGAEWKIALAAIDKGVSLATHLSHRPKIRWRKIAYIDGLTSTVRELMAEFGELATGLTSSSLPMCVVAERDRPAVVSLVRRLYPRLASDFLEWLGGSGPLAVCWVMGFKPRGDDARPDRGLPPLCRTLIGATVDLMTVVYGPALKDTWRKLDGNPRGLASHNGLWESVLTCSDAVLADAATMPSSYGPNGYLRAHWSHLAPTTDVVSLEMAGIVQRIGENDVDTVIHLVLTRCTKGMVFEGLCNPPGGDWSGISLQSDDRKVERRWLGLPRVTALDAKRPDHVLQFFIGSGDPTIVAIESKDKARTIERQIGSRLAAYVDALLETRSSVERVPGGEWSHSTTRTALRGSRPKIVTGAAAQVHGPDELHGLLERAETDFAIGITVPVARNRCDFHLRARSLEGRHICDFIASLNVEIQNVRVLHHR